MRSYFCTSVHETWTKFLRSYSLTLGLTAGERVFFFILVVLRMDGAVYWANHYTADN